MRSMGGILRRFMLVHRRDFSGGCAGSSAIQMAAADLAPVMLEKAQPRIPASPSAWASQREILSNGKYKSSEHRATINTEKERLSVAAFHGPDHDSMVGPLRELLKGGKEHYKSMSYQDYMKTFFSAKLEGRTLLESMKLND